MSPGGWWNPNGRQVPQRFPSSVLRFRRSPKFLALGSAPLGFQALLLLPSGNAGALARRPPPIPLFQPFTQAGQGEAPIPVLTPLVPGGYGDAGGAMREPHRAIGGILMLPPGSAGAEGVDAALPEQGVIVVGDAGIVGHGARSDPGGPGAFQCTPGTSLHKDGVGRGRR